MVVTALLIIPLMIFAAFAIDVGSWYAEASRVQRAADAAALAGVVWMPDLDKAEQAAYDTAARNGYVHGSNAVVTVSVSGESRLRVDIDAPAEAFFGKVVTDGILIERWATASFIDPIPMGNPTSALGTADLGFTDPQGFWLNAHAYCFSRGAGDLLNSAQQNGSSCSSEDNPLYREEGYVYVIDKPAGVAVSVDVLHAGLCKRPGWTTSRGEANLSAGPTIEFELFAPDLDQPTTDNIVPANQFGVTQTTDPSDCPDWGQWNTDPDSGWTTMFTIPAGAQEGRWLLSAATPENSSHQHKNMYGLRVDDPSTPERFCSTLTASSCPSITARDFLSIYIGEATDSPSDGAGNPAEFYFAEVSEDHAGKTLEVRLWDPAEGSEYLQFLNPLGQPVDFEWRTIDCAEYPDTCRGRTDIAGGDVDSCPYTSGACLDTRNLNLHDRYLQLRIELPADYACDGTDCWWQILYAPIGAGDVNDTTTWSIRVLGDPLRLVE